MRDPISVELRQSQVSNLKHCVKNDYVLNKAEYPRGVTLVQSLRLNYQPKYNSHRNPQSKSVSNQLMFAQRKKTGDDEGDRKEKEKIPRRNLDHTTCNELWRKSSLCWE